MDDLISRQAAIDKAINIPVARIVTEDKVIWRKAAFVEDIEALPPAQQWIPVTERLPEIHKRVILSITDGTVMVGFQGEPNCIWQVTDDDGKKIWVYDPDDYTDNVDDLPTAKDCWFDSDDQSVMTYTSVTSLNYRERFPGVVAWQPLPRPWEGDADAH